MVHPAAGAGGQHEEDKPLYSPVSMMVNNATLDYARTATSAISGCTAGVLGLTGFAGFGFYLVCCIILSLLLLSRTGSRYDKFFPSVSPLLTFGLMSGLFTYILSWTFLYGMVHVY